jgi:RNA polymerase sigma-B factor
MDTTGSDDLLDLHRQYRRTRDPRLREALVGRHADLVHRLAGRFAYRGEELDDLVQVAFWGLLKAIDRFDPDRGARFAAFATPTILGELKRHFRNHRWNVRVPRAVQENYLHVRDTSVMLSQDLGRSPSVDEIAGCTGLSAPEVLEAIGAGASFRPLSLNDASAPQSGRGDGVLGGPCPDLLSAEARCQVASLVASLPPREQRIIWLRFGQELRQHEIAAQLGISQMHVSRLLARSLDKLKRREASSPATGRRETR